MTTTVRSTRARLPGLVLRAVLVAGLGIDAYVHFHLAGDRDAIGSTITQGALFRLQAGAAVVLASALLVVRRRPLLYLASAAVAGSALGAVLLYRYVDVGAIGPIPDMYEPVWYFQKSLSAVAEAATVLAGAAGALLQRRTSRTSPELTRQQNAR